MTISMRTLAAGIVVAVLTAGCAQTTADRMDGIDDASHDGTEVSQSAAQAADSGTAGQQADAADSAADAAVDQADQSPDVARIGAGEGYGYEDGLTVSVPKAVTRKPGEFALGMSKGHRLVVVTVELTNHTGSAFDATLATVSMTYGQRGTPAEEVYDDRLGEGFTTRIIDGRTGSADFGFSVPADGLDDLVVEVSPDWDHEPALFTGAVK